MGRPGLRADNKVHALHIGFHSFRQGDQPKVGKAQAAFSFPYRIKNGLHGSIFNEQRHKLQQQCLFAAYVGGNAGAHELGRAVQPHAVMHDGTQLLKGIFAQLGIHLRGHIQGKVSQGSAGEQLAQIYRDQHFYRAPVPYKMHLFPLQLQNGGHHGGAKELRHRYRTGFGALPKGLCIQHQGHQVQSTVRFRRAGQVIGGAFPATGPDGPGILQEAVFQFSCGRCLQPAEHAVFIGNIHSVFLGKIFRHQSFNKG